MQYFVWLLKFKEISQLPTYMLQHEHIPENELQIEKKGFENVQMIFTKQK